MKKTLNGTEAFSRLVTAPIPEKTKTYTPIAHGSVISKFRDEVFKAGYNITEENYRCSQNGEVASGLFKITCGDDPDMKMVATFSNSYNKQFAFRFGLGAMVNVCDNGLFIPYGSFGKFRRIHKGEADILADSVISDYIIKSEPYWEKLIEFKTALIDQKMSERAKMVILGELFFNREILTTYQMNIIKKHIKTTPIIYGGPTDSAWYLYNHITQALKESHPVDWLEHHMILSEVFVDYIPSMTFEEEEPIKTSTTTASTLTTGKLEEKLTEIASEASL